MPVLYRPARSWPALPDSALLRVPAPPVPTDTGAGWLAALSGLGMLPLLAMGFTAGGSAGPWLLMLSVPGAVGGVCAALYQRRRSRRRAAELRSRWRAAVTALLARCAEAARQQRLALDRLHPGAEALASLAASEARFERRADDADALTVCVGDGAVQALVRISPEESGPAADPELAAELAAAVRSTQLLDAAPIAVGLRDVGVLAVCGPPAETTPVMTALVAQLAALHLPGEVAMAIVAAATGEKPAWQWAEALSHVRPAHGGGGLRCDADEAARWAAASGASAHRVLIVTDYLPGQSAELDRVLGRALVPAILVCRGGLPPRVGARLDVTARTLTADRASPVRLAAVEGMSAAAAAEVAAAVDIPDPPPAPTQAQLLAGSSPAGPGEVRAPVGLDLDGAPVWLDLREPALGGDGPHGLLVGATGSGKSVALQSMISGLAARLAPQDLSFLLIDFKGGAAFDAFGSLPHLAGLVTNLDVDPHELTRIKSSLGAELDRRQRVARQHPGERLPSLLIVVDEAGELLTAAPDFAELLVRIGRVGRSLGVHLIVSTQRWEDGKLRALDTHLRLRLCLRTFTADDSRSVLGTDAAARLPPQPGSAILSVDGRHEQLQIVAPQPLPAFLDGPRAGAVCLPPLPRSFEMSDPYAIGLVDLPDVQRQEPLVLDLDGVGGHIAVAGGPRAGVSTTLMTVALAAHAATGPADVHVIDLAAGLRELRELPSVGTYAGPDADAGWLRQIVDGVREILDERLAAQSTPHGRVLLLIDGLGLLRGATRDDPQVDEALADIAARGLTANVHLVLGCRRWADVRPALLAACGMRLELRLGEPAESHAGRLAATTLAGVPGRGLLPDGRQFQIARRPPQTAPHLGAVTAAILPLPQRVSPPPGGGDGAFLLGVAGRSHAPLVFDVLAPGAHLVISGEARSGRSTVLRRLVAHLREMSSELVDVTVIEPRRHRDLGTFLDPKAATDRLRGMALEFRRHLDQPAHGRTDHRRREHVVAVDDVGLLDSGPFAARSTGLGHALTELASFIPWADTLGLHFVVVPAPMPHRVGYDPLVAALQQAGTVELQLGGDRDALGCRTGKPAPPGRGRFLTHHASPATVQCYLDVAAAERDHPVQR